MTRPIVQGKKYAGEKFPTVGSAEEVAEIRKLNLEHAHENAVPIEVWFNAKGHRDEVMQSAMRAFTKVTKATLEAFDEIFETF